MLNLNCLSAGYSEDSDYTSDLNYPVGGQGANSSASQFRTAANQLATPQRSLETSRENSYERDDHQVRSIYFCRYLDPLIVHFSTIGNRTLLTLRNFIDIFFTNIEY